MRYMFTNDRQGPSIDRDTNTVRLRPLQDRDRDERDAFRIPLYTNLIPTNKMRAIKHAYEVLHHAWREDCERGKETDALNEAVRFILTLYAT